MRTLDFAFERGRLVDHTLRPHGIRNEAVLEAIRSVPREEFVPPEIKEFAYRDSALPLECGQTISQPFIVALMTEELNLKPSDKVLEIGTGSGYSAAVLSELATQVFTIERLPDLTQTATKRLKRLGYKNVHVRQGDGTLGWPEEAPFDAIVVTAGGPTVPQPLLDQLAVGGRLVMPVGSDLASQQLIRIVRRGADDYRQQEITAVRFVPLIGEQGWEDKTDSGIHAVPPIVREAGKRHKSVVSLIQDACHPFTSIATADLWPLLERVGQARIVLIGEASHGTSEFYRMRAQITKALIEHKQFDFVAIEADWPDAYRVHDFVTHRQRSEPYDWEAFSRFPTWMWRNHEVLDFIHWLRDFNLSSRSSQAKVGFYGLDLYSLFTSIQCVLNYLERVDPPSAAVARVRYGCLSPWEGDPAMYGKAALTGKYGSCEADVTKMLTNLAQRRVSQSMRNGEDLFDAQRNAALIADAEKYYRVMYYGSDESWNHRDSHMFQTLLALLDRHGSESKAVVWAHNSHLGNAAATQFGEEGQFNIGELCRNRFGNQVYSIGQGTNTGSVAAASEWEGPMEIKQVRPAHPDSYERLMHLAEIQSFFLPLTKSAHPEIKSAMEPPRLERAIGVIYRPNTELQSHYFQASLSQQFDEWIWFDETSAVNPLTTRRSSQHEPAHPFATIDE